MREMRKRTLQKRDDGMESSHASIECSHTATAGNFEIIPRVDASYQDMTYFDPTLTREIAQLDEVTVRNASLTFQPPGGKWRVTLGVNNVTD